jgi:hypothetical protein
MYKHICMEDHYGSKSHIKSTFFQLTKRDSNNKIKMKLKDVAFRIVSAIIAIAYSILAIRSHAKSAVSSSYVNYTTSSSQLLRSYCTRAGRICESTGSSPCIISITWTDGPLVDNYQSKENTCTIRINGTSPNYQYTKHINKANTVLK